MIVEQDYPKPISQEKIPEDMFFSGSFCHVSVVKQLDSDVNNPVEVEVLSERRSRSVVQFNPPCPILLFKLAPQFMTVRVLLLFPCPFVVSAFLSLCFSS